MNNPNSFVSLKVDDLKKFWKDDLLSGFLVFLIALPLSLGIAMASGFPALSGIIAAAVGGLIVSIFSGSRVAIVGPAAGLIVIVLNGVEKLGGGDSYLGYRYTLAAITIAGLFQIVFGFFRSGKLSDYFPSTVVHGMMASIGIMIIVKQIHVVLGVVPKDKTIIGAIVEIPQSVVKANPLIALIGLLSILMIILWPKLKISFLKKIPAPMLIVVLSIFVSLYLGFSQGFNYNYGGNDFFVDGKYLVALPENIVKSFRGPDFFKVNTFSFWTVTFSVTLVASLESLLSASAVAILDPEKRRVRLNKDLIALGIGTMISGLLGGLPMIVEIVRSSANLSNGAKSMWANFFHGMIIFIFVLFFPKLLNLIPLSALAGILITVGFRLASPKEFKKMYTLGKDQFFIFVATILIILKTDLLVGVISGILIKIAIHLSRGIPLNMIFASKCVIEEIEYKNYNIKIYDAAIFWNLCRIKQKMVRLPDGGKITIDVSNARLIDHTVMDFLELFEKNYKERGGTVGIKGLEQFNNVSQHPLGVHQHK